MCDPVTVGLAVSASSGAFAGIAAGAAVGAAWGVGINAAVNIATGRGAFENVGKAALFGAVSGGLGTYAKPFADVAAMGGGGFFGSAASYAVSAAGPGAIALSTGAGSLISAMQPSTEGYTPVGAYNQQALNMNTNVATTGSGGRQAAKSLATAISRTKKRKLTQRDVGDLSLDTSSFTNSGLQLA